MVSSDSIQRTFKQLKKAEDMSHFKMIFYHTGQGAENQKLEVQSSTLSKMGKEALSW